MSEPVRMSHSSPNEPFGRDATVREQLNELIASMPQRIRVIRNALTGTGMLSRKDANAWAWRIANMPWEAEARRRAEEEGT